MRFALIAISLSLSLLRASFASAAPLLPTGVRLDPAAAASPLGNFPLTISVSPDARYFALLLSGWREQGVQIVDHVTGKVVQTIEQPSAFVGIAFSPDGHSLVASGGNEDALFVYDFHDGHATLSARVDLAGERSRGVQYPAGLAFSGDGSRVYVAENLANSVAVVDLASRAVVQRLQTDRYPYGVAVAKNGGVFVSAWGDDSVDHFVPKAGRLVRARRITVGRHPSALLLDAKDARLYVASASTDSIAVVETKSGRLVTTLADHPPGIGEGSTPNALALSKDGRLFVAEADNNAVAVFRAGRLLGRIPTEWYPSALAVVGGELFVVSAKGQGTAPNPAAQQPGTRIPPGSPDYTLGQIAGSLMRLPLALEPSDLRKLTRRVTVANHWNRTVTAPRYPPFRHVIYVVKENRTYDQFFGDLKEGDGDASLAFFPEAISPNQHALAQRFGLYDRFFVNAEVSADGHNWSTAAYATDYLEKTVPSEYSSRGRNYDYEGTNQKAIVDEEDDVAAPAAGYLWSLALRRKISLRDYGEFVVSAHDLGDKKSDAIFAGRRELRGVIAPGYPGFDLSIPDQKRADIWLREFKTFVEQRSLPALEIIRLPNDHTAGGAAGKPTPRAYAADNDLALGRIIQALTHSPFWKETVVFVLEDDAQNGPDHVDSHRAPMLVISPYSRGGVIHRFANTTDVLATMEEILGLGSLSQFDHFGRPLRDSFGTVADLTPYDAIVPAVDLGETNPATAPAAKQSALLDLSRADASDDGLFNRILWSMIKGDAPMPPVRRVPAGALAP